MFMDCYLYVFLVLGKYGHIRNKKFLKKPLALVSRYDKIYKHAKSEQEFGSLVKWDNVSFASLSQEFDSPRIHHLWQRSSVG